MNSPTGDHGVNVPLHPRPFFIVTFFDEFVTFGFEKIVNKNHCLCTRGLGYCIRFAQRQAQQEVGPLLRWTINMLIFQN